MTQRVLYVALGEQEVPAARALAALLGDVAETRIVTWLPRLAGDGVTALEPLARRYPADVEPFTAALASAGYPHPSMAADYDRDWHFASVARKAAHVSGVAAAVTAQFDAFSPDLIVSAVGGETTRTVTEALAKARGIPTAYFNSIPLPGRFVLLKSLDAPFVPARGRDTSYRPAGSETAMPTTGRLGQPPARGSILEGLPRLWSQTAGGERSYPPSWLWRKASSMVKDATVRRRPFGGTQFDPSHQLKVLYPLHDERDFQVAVRERHAVPQWALIRYLSSTLPAGAHLYLKAHPEHLAAHHPSRWPQIADRPNVHFLPLGVSSEQAIRDADVVLTLASSMGLEAVRAQKPVVVYGQPFYAGRGATTDVADPRDLARAISSAAGSIPDPASVDALLTEMMDWSWPGLYTSPRRLEPDNLRQLAAALREIVI